MAKGSIPLVYISMLIIAVILMTFASTDSFGISLAVLFICYVIMFVFGLVFV